MKKFITGPPMRRSPKIRAVMKATNATMSSTYSTIAITRRVMGPGATR
jgi:hypothetical protein